MSQKIEELYNKFNLVSTTVSKLEKAAVKLERKMSNAIDDLEQYGRRSCLTLNGLKRFPNLHHSYNEFVELILKTINNQLNLGLTINYIDVAHFLPRAKNGKVPIIIKFIRRSDRNAVYHKKRLFSASGLAITESLTKTRLQLFNETRHFLGQQNVWTQSGKIYCKT